MNNDINYYDEFFKSIENIPKNNSLFDKLPKILLIEILSYLELDEMGKIFRLSKSFLKLLCDEGNNTNILWKGFIQMESTESIEEKEIDEFLKEIEKTEYEKHLNKYSLYLKVNN